MPHCSAWQAHDLGTFLAKFKKGSRQNGVRLDGERLTYLYQARGWSQQDLARKSGLDARTITKVKNGGPCDASTHQCLAQALDVEPEELLADRDPPETGIPQLLEEYMSGKPAEAEPADALANPYFTIEECWKVIDLRSPQPAAEPAAAPVKKGAARTTRGKGKAETNGAAEPLAVTVWDRYRIRKLDAGDRDIVFPYLTWGERIECLDKPPTAVWEKVQVRPGDLVHSEKQWELRLPAPKGPAGTKFECAPVQLKFVDAFHGLGQTWWQVRVAYTTDILILQILFDPASPCRAVRGLRALFGERQFEPAPEGPFLLRDGSIASWHIKAPRAGAFYKLEWDW
jgi:transcriptional regulator with XRE-family HTH domain